jgi:hypothetical protein
MIRLLGRLACAVFVIAMLSGLLACGGHSSGGPNVPATVRLSPGSPVSLTLGTTATFSATAQNSGGQSVAALFTFQSSDTSILNFSPGGSACAGTWNAPFYSVCSPLGTGVAQVTAATAGGVISPPTYVFVHAPVDQIQLSVVPQNSPPPPCTGQQNIPPACTPTGAQVSGCFTANQPQTLQATAYSQGHDITSSVGPFTWNAGTTGVVTLTPTISTSTGVVTNLATAAPLTPGLAQVIASAAGSSSQPFNFETCPVQCVAVQVATGATQSGQTTFITNKGTAEKLTAWAVDVQGCIVAKPALTWTSSQPASIVSGGTSGCAAGTTCALTTPQPGSASITAACTPPTCNAGFPLTATTGVTPLPVYPVTAISGLVNGLPGSFNVIATSTTCADTANPNCSVSLYSLSSAKNAAGVAIPIPTPPNSLIFAPAGDRAYVGSPYGALIMNPANFGSSNSAFTAIPAPGTLTGAVQGKVLAVAPRGNFAVFADNVSTPNYVYVVNDAGASPTATALNITGATAATFSNDGLKAFIAGFDRLGNPTLFVYSTLQALQSFSIPVGNPVNGFAPSSTGSFTFLNGGSATSTISVRNICDNQLSTEASNVLPVINLPAQPLMLKSVPPGNFPVGNSTIPALQAAGLDVLLGIDNTGIDIIATSASQAAATALCPQNVALAKLQANPSQTFAPIHINVGQGTFNPINFFVSPDETQVYIVASNFSGVLIYNLSTRSTSAIQLVGSGNPLPISADMTPDGSFVYIAATDGLLHAVSTFPALDVTQISFPALPSSTNAFCSNAIATPNCSLNLAVVQP